MRAAARILISASKNRDSAALAQRQAHQHQAAQQQGDRPRLRHFAGAGSRRWQLRSIPANARLSLGPGGLWPSA